VATDRDLRRAAVWLKAHGAPDAAPTPLLAARLRARRRQEPQILAVCTVVAGLNSVLLFDRGAVGRALGFLALALLAAPARWWSLRALRRAERRIGATLARRVTHPTAVGWREVLGPRRLAVAAIMYGSALALGAVDLAYARTAQDRAVVAALVAGLVALAAISTAWINELVRRPALAEDALSLAADDILRAEDGHAVAVTLLPGALGVITTLALTPPVPTPVYASCYALVVLSFLVWLWGQNAVTPSLRVFDRAPISDRMRFIP
jgi:hypothetical protein